MNSDIIYGIIGIAVAVIAYIIAPQLWEMSGNDRVCGTTVSAETATPDCKEAYERFEFNRDLLNLGAVVFGLIGIVLLINGFR